MPPNCSLCQNHSGRLAGRDPVRPEADRLDHPSDRARLDQVAGLDRRAVLEALAVHDRVDAFRLGLDLAHLGELIEGGDARLVGHVVLAVLHHPDPERRPLDRDARAEDQLDRRVVQDLVLAAGRLRLREGLGEGGQQVRLLRED